MLIKQFRKELGYSQEELGAKMDPPVTRAAVAKWETGRTQNLKRSQIEQLSKMFDIKPSTLMGIRNEDTVEYYQDMEESNSIKIPVLGKVAAGTPIEMVEDVVDYEEIPTSMTRTGEYFALRVKGDSMQPRICEGDILIVKKQEDALSGDIVIAAINGQDATCKRLMKYADGISLISLNQKYDPMYFSNEQIKNLPITILGKVVENRQKF